MDMVDTHTNTVNIFECKPCDVICSKKNDWDRHILTKKHGRRVNGYAKEIDITHTDYGCECGKSYANNSGLWKHSKICKGTLEVNENENISIDIKNKSIKNKDVNFFMIEMMKNHSDLQKQNNELQKQIIEMCKNTTIITQNNNINSHNKTFNLMFFLNEQCKDAMNISEFVESFDLQLEDLESVGNLGYVEGITKLMVDKLNSMDLYKRPIHCSDAKREIIYIKDDNKWEKETRDYPKLRRAIKHISFKNMKLAPLWSDTYPDSKLSESNLNDVYMKIIIQSTGGSGDIAISENKIIRRIAKEFVIDKHLIMSQR